MYFRFKILMLMFVLLGASTSNAREPEVFPGAPIAPAMRLPDLGGQIIDLQQFRGQVLLVNFWATWCPPCREEMPSIWKLKNALGSQAFRVVAVNMGETKIEVETFLPSPMKRDFVVLLDKQGVSSQAWQVPALPTSYLIDKQGRIRYRLVGSTEWDSFDNKKRVAGLLAEQLGEPVACTEKLGVKLFLR